MAPPQSNKQNPCVNAGNGKKPRVNLGNANVHIGFLAESDACLFLEKQGLTLLKRNFRIKSGEIDLIMQDKEYIVFVEVKMRTKTTCGTAIEVISPAKKSRIIRAASFYLLQKNQYYETPCRFDVIGISPEEDTKDMQITWIKDAFRVEYR